MEELQNYLNSIRRDFADQPLDEKSVADNPFKQFEKWFEEAVNAQILDPYAMSLATVSYDDQPSTRIVYLRGISEEGFKFYTNYNSQKGKDLLENKKVALNFFWGELERQIRIEGEVEKLSKKESDVYFAGRPRESQIGAWASTQSSIIKNRKELEDKVRYYTEHYKDMDVPRPDNWGGYIVKPLRVEFWQGRPNRLHDRLVFSKNETDWELNRFAP
ncbi:MAG: pyridoxamine 5'-phosphate oxidase [Vicingus serpentipes]|nr:pyridoxamine 5'-phosphate oxidase [Vicingus serpentipes]